MSERKENVNGVGRIAFGPTGTSTTLGIGPLAEAIPKTTLSGSARVAMERTMTAGEFLKIAMEVMDSDEMYDLLPGDGHDDHIIATFERLLKEKLRSKHV